MNFISGSVQSTAHQSTWLDFLSRCVQVLPWSGLMLMGEPYTRAVTIFLLLGFGSSNRQPGVSVRPFGCLSLTRLKSFAPVLEQNIPRSLRLTQTQPVW